MKAKYGARTVATAMVIERPFALAASAALLSVPCVHAMALRQQGRAE